MNLDRIIAVRNAKTVYRDGETCVKVFNRDYAKADVLNEALNQARVEEIGLHVPKILEVTTIEGKWAIVSEFIRGKTLAQLMEEDPDHRDVYLERFVSLQAEVQSKDCPLLNSLKTKLHRKIDLARVDAPTRYDLHTRLNGMPNQHAVCHGDFWPANVIISEEDVPYVIDWSHATWGSGAADAARTYLLFWLNGEIDGADAYLAAYCRKTGVEKAQVQKWMPIVAASQSVSGNEKEREFLLSWVDVVDYE